MTDVKDCVLLLTTTLGVEYKEDGDMDAIQITKKEETADGWRFVVEVGQGFNEIGFSVFLDKDYWNELTGCRYSPDELIMRSFRFLLRREPQISIQRSFHVRDIQKYFSAYEDSMRGFPLHA